ncbi:pyruvate, phosphate dikinase [Holospora elegans E1]|uniref:Pyruvate, phosphate dikinase n=1 Tax=Holospora elegans E1 TaxID=1427503 RepID=A0A023DZ21_9PROT|nr:pyruvate, phosphate dikinase [Holospora elegans E1]
MTYFRSCVILKVCIIRLWCFFLNFPLSFSQESSFFSEEALRQDVFSPSKAGYLKMLETLQVPVPPFFLIPYLHPFSLEGLQEELLRLQIKSGKVWNDQETGQSGLFVSVRSSFKVSMPGMLDSLLNVGLTFNHALKANKEYLWRSYIKLICHYGKLVEQIDETVFPKISKTATREEAIEFERIFQEHAGYSFPQDANEQLIKAINMVRNSWNNSRAQSYRLHEKISSSSGVDVVIQVMVFGNFNQFSGTGILFTQNPSTGKKEFFGEYSIQAQGEDIVSGGMTPGPLSLLETHLPCAYKTLKDIAEKIDNFFVDMQDIEFTIEQKKVWILQTRPGKRTKTAELRILSRYVAEGVLSMQDALKRLSLNGLEQVYHSYLENLEGLENLGKGLGASPGAIFGILAIRQETVDFLASSGRNIIFAAQETHCDDVACILKASGVITATGGMTCHGAVVTRGLGKPCVTSVQELKVHCDSIEVCGQFFPEGTLLTIDGTTGNIWKGRGALKVPEKCEELEEFLEFSHRVSAIKVYANADTLEDWNAALAFNPEGIGLCRSEHMFFKNTHLPWFQGWILGLQEDLCFSRISALQEEDYTTLLKQLNGKRLTVRLLDPPLHEFLPCTFEAEKTLSHQLEVSLEKIKELASGLKENNPMLGKRGARLGILRPEIYDLQVQSLFKAAERVHKEGIPVDLGIMIPFVTVPEEFTMIKKRILQRAIWHDLTGVIWNVGVMIEIPSSALQASFFAQEADFICFGTNDLTQMILGLSRDDTAYMIEKYQSLGIFSKDPFQSIHESSVGKILSFACETILKINPNISLSVCGEHAGDPESIDFFYSLGIRGVSCSAYRGFKAKLACAKVTLEKDSFLDSSSLKNRQIA